MNEWTLYSNSEQPQSTSTSQRTTLHEKGYFRDFCENKMIFGIVDKKGYWEFSQKQNDFRDRFNNKRILGNFRENERIFAKRGQDFSEGFAARLQ